MNAPHSRRFARFADAWHSRSAWSAVASAPLWGTNGNSTARHQDAAAQSGRAATKRFGVAAGAKRSLPGAEGGDEGERHRKFIFTGRISILDYLRRRMSSKAAAPRPARAKVEGSGIRTPMVNDGNIVLGGGVGDTVGVMLKNVDQPIPPPPATAAS